MREYENPEWLPPVEVESGSSRSAVLKSLLDQHYSVISRHYQPYSGRDQERLEGEKCVADLLGVLDGNVEMAVAVLKAITLSEPADQQNSLEKD